MPAWPPCPLRLTRVSQAGLSGARRTALYDARQDGRFLRPVVLRNTGQTTWAQVPRQPRHQPNEEYGSPWASTQSSVAGPTFSVRNTALCVYFLTSDRNAQHRRLTEKQGRRAVHVPTSSNQGVSYQHLIDAETLREVAHCCLIHAEVG